MPDRYGETNPPDELPDDIWAAEHRAILTANCGLCDDDGYTPALQVCDHQQHSTPEGRARAQQILHQALTKRGDT